MGTEKRERQKQARQAKIEELRKTEQRENVRRRGVMIGAAVVAFLAFAIGFSVLTKDDDEPVAATTDTSAVDDTTDPSDSTPDDSTPEADPLPCPPTDGSAEQTQSFPAAPDMCIDTEKTYTATMVTDAGTIVIELADDTAPVTANNFVYLARYKYFDGLTFHRVIPDFVLQGGDPQGTGAGGPGYQIADELPDPDDYQAGSLAMANSGPDTNGSQFFIVTSENGAKTLVEAVGGEARYSLFGQVIEGMDVVQAIEADGDPTGTPTTTHIIESVTITES
ncbi:peptidylprolyl isomerase [Actinospongicola halichondriae]|uniref:peptidylprolyl isomerase n=1 Tax=Actinospongicola halichondriae TaxID=3236844 RepID=UPI003D48D8B7